MTLADFPLTIRGSVNIDKLMADQAVPAKKASTHIKTCKFCGVIKNHITETVAARVTPILKIFLCPILSASFPHTITVSTMTPLNVMDKYPKKEKLMFRFSI